MKVLSFILVTLMLIGASCTKSTERSIQASKDYALIMTDISLIVPLVAHTVQSKGYVMDRIRSAQDSLNSCASYLYVSGDTVDITNQNLVIEVLYSQCVDFDGAHKNGSLMLNISNYFDVDSATCSVQLKDFSINNNIFSGVINFKRKGSDEFEVSATGMQIFVGTKQILYKGSWRCEMGTGTSASFLFDNLIEVEELGTLEDRFGNVFQTIGSGLVRDLSCNWFGSGVVELEDAEGESQILDYGSGSCENVATITSVENDINFAIGQ